MNQAVAPPRHRRSRGALLVVPLVLAVLAMALAGCNILGAVAAKTLPPPTIRPKYTDFKGRTVATMVWADTGVEIDFPRIQVDIGTALQKKLADAAKADRKQKQLQGITFPYPAASVVRFQQEHPEIEGQPAVEVAPRLGVERLIYIEVERFQTRADTAVELYLGTLTANVKVIEVADGKATVAFEEGGVGAQFPPKAPAEGVQNVGDLRIYRGLVDEFTTQVAKRFVSYQEEE